MSWEFIITNHLKNRPGSVGEVLGKYHPHGDKSVYDSMVRMAREWNMRYTLIDKQETLASGW